MPYSSQYYGNWHNMCHYKSGRVVLWIVKWWLYLCITYMFLDCIYGSFTGKYPLNKQSYNLHDIRQH